MPIYVKNFPLILNSLVKKCVSHNDLYILIILSCNYYMKLSLDKVNKTICIAYYNIAILVSNIWRSLAFF